jgi:hypothetical protein
MIFVDEQQWATHSAIDVCLLIGIKRGQQMPRDGPKMQRLCTVALSPSFRVSGRLSGYGKCAHGLGTRTSTLI